MATSEALTFVPGVTIARGRNGGHRLKTGNSAC
jgi:hypothetical protein